MPIFLRLQLLVEHVDTKTFADTVQVGDVFGQLIDWLHLLFQKLSFQIVGQMRIIVVISHFVEIKKRLECEKKRIEVNIMQNLP